VKRAWRAHAHARIRAVKSRLLDRGDVLALFCATDEASTRRALSTFGIDPSQELFPQLFARLLRVYRTAIRAHRGENELFRAFLRLHAIDDPKADLEEFADDPATAAAVEAIQRAHGEDVATATLALDRWASRALLDCAPHEPLARKLVECVVRERDNELLRRGSRFRGISEPAARAMTILLHEPVDPLVLRGERRKLCRRAFIGHTFELAPSIAVILYAEEELRGLTALAERRGDAKLDPVVERTIAAGLWGAA
jgi:hypothetical protein